MRAVWSFWSRPFYAFHHRVWPSERHHGLAWILSVETARQHYPDTALVADSAGARLLVDVLGLPFGRVSTALDGLAADADPEWWTLGKLHAYRAQDAPFLHLDSDVFLWRALPPRVAAGAVIAQNPEWFPFDGPSWYQPAAMEASINAVGGWLPEEWYRYTARRAGMALSCGILGGHRTDVLRNFADRAIHAIEHPANAAAWMRISDKIGNNILLEQYLLAAHLEFHGVEARCLFDSTEESIDPEAARRVGYTHLIAGSKRYPELTRRLEARVCRDYPEPYERVLRMFPAAAAA